MPAGRPKRPVVRINPDGQFSKRFDSIAAAVEEGFVSHYIIQCCKGRQPFHKNFIWRYEIDYELEKQSNSSI